MGQVIRIPDELYKKLETFAVGFDSPASVIERLVLYFEEHGEELPAMAAAPNKAKEAEKLEIVFFPQGYENFKDALLKTRRASVKLYRTDGTTEVKVWNADRFQPSSHLTGNLRSGFLRGWKEKGIYKAELSVIPGQTIQLAV